MPKVTLDMNTFKALASDTRLDILRALDGKKMSLRDISKATNLNKATLHEHLAKLNEAGLVKRREREGHKWVYYKLTWKGEGLLHPENTRIVVLFTTTFVTLFLGIVALVNYVRGYFVERVIPFTQTQFDSGSYNPELLDEIMNSARFVKYELAYGPSKGTTPYENFDWIYGNWGGNIITSKAFLAVDSETLGILTLGESDIGSSASQTVIDVAHDPILQQVAIVCIIIFGILLSISIWRLKKNKKTTL